MFYKTKITHASRQSGCGALFGPPRDRPIRTRHPQGLVTVVQGSLLGSVLSNLLLATRWGLWGTVWTRAVCFPERS